MSKLLLERSLRANFSWVLSGNVLYSACQWCIILVIARLGSPAQVGEYALGMAVSAPILLFANFQLRAIVASDLSARFTFTQYFTFRVFSLALALAVIAAAGFLSQGTSRQGGIVLLVGFAQVLEFLSDTYYGRMQKHDRLDRLAKSLAIKGPLALAALWGAMYATHNIAWAIAGLALGRLVVVLFWDSRPMASETTSWTGLEWNPRELLQLLRTVLPLGIISMLVALNTNIPWYFVEAYHGRSELGIFSALVSLMSVGGLVVAAFGQSIFRPVAQAVLEGDRLRYRSFVWQSTLLALALGCAGVAVAAVSGRQILTFLFRPEYGQHAGVLLWLMIVGTVNWIGSGAGYILTAGRRLRPQVPLLAVTSLVLLAASAWAIPRHGLQGAAEANLVGGLVQLMGTGLILWRIDQQLEPLPAPLEETAQAASLEA